MKLKKILLAASLAVLMVCGVYIAVLMGTSEPTYDGSNTDLLALYEDPESYDNSDADGVAAIIVNENLDKTTALNVVFSVVFNFRGYDTMGESFILIAAIAGCLVILRKAAKKAVPADATGADGETEKEDESE
ncbi:MAG: hypothetical protein LUH09_11020 [Clostridiales bacterium]|nr:hypothetical protein [Clostridiales bacterium]MCD7803403.1 hypothetical protein [Clostridiales bacterium]